MKHLGILFVMVLFLQQQLLVAVMPGGDLPSGQPAGDAVHHVEAAADHDASVDRQAPEHAGHEQTFCDIQCLCPASGCQSVADARAALPLRLSPRSSADGYLFALPLSPYFLRYRPPIV